MDGVMQLADEFLAAGLATPDRLAMAVIGLSRADRWSYARLHRAVLDRTALAPGQAPADATISPTDEDPAERAVTLLATIATTSGDSPESCTAGLRNGDSFPPLSGINAQDRLMLPQDGFTSGPILRMWQAGAAILIPARGVTPAQWGLLGARHGASIIAAPAARLGQMLAANWQGWPALRGAVVLDHAPDDLPAAWQERTATPLASLGR